MQPSCECHRFFASFYLDLISKVTPKHVCQLLFPILMGKKRKPPSFFSKKKNFSTNKPSSNISAAENVGKFQVSRYVGAICTTCCWLTRKSWHMNLPRAVPSRLRGTRVGWVHPKTPLFSIILDHIFARRWP